MSFWDHLEELRGRLMRALFVFFIGFGVCYFFAENFLDVLRRPLFEALAEEQRKLYFTSLFENFLVHLKISGYGSLFVLSPYFFWEIWSFISPGLYARERKLVVPFIAMATLFFIGGAMFAYFVLMPVGFKYFVTYGGPFDVPMLTIDSYYSTVLKLLLLFGIAFELPVLVVLLGFLGVLDAQTLRTHRKTAIIGITFLAAIFAPPDAVSMLLLGIPLVLMYEGAIWVVYWLGLRRAKQRAAEAGLVPVEKQPENPLEGRSK